jgi:hypothetical protein
MKKITLIIALAFFISSNAQNVTTNGTILLDDATSRTRVVVDAFLNSSNRVHELIEEIAPFYEGDFTTNNTVLVNTIETVSPKTSLASATNYTDSATNSLAKSLATTISNTVTKAYVESLGIESGVDAQTVTNMTACRIFLCYFVSSPPDSAHS